MRTLEEQHKLLEELLTEARKRESAGERVTKEMNKENPS